VLTVALIVQIVALLIAPVALAYWLKRRLELSWVLFLGGALAFSLSWIVTALVPLPVEVGLLISSIAQMGILYLVYRFLLSTIHTEREALLVGVGLAGIEMLILVFFLIVPTFVQMNSLRDATDDTLVSLVARTERVSEEEVEPSDVDKLRESIDDYWSTPWYAPLIQAIPLLTALPIQMALAVIVLGALTHNSLQPLLGAIALHFLSRSLPTFASLVGGIAAWLALALLAAGIAIWFLSRLWPLVQEQTLVAVKARHKAEKRSRRA
jgi:uncharacterized membrane protein YhfC